MKPETIALHAGYEGDPATNAATTPIYQTTSFTFDDTQHGADLFNLAVPGNIYSRIMNPTNAVLEQLMNRFVPVLQKFPMHSVVGCHYTKAYNNRYNSVHSLHLCRNLA